MAALYWPPCVALRDASLRDIQEAYAAWHILHGKEQAAANLPARAFMQGMMQKFPDTAATRREPHG